MKRTLIAACVTAFVAPPALCGDGELLRHDLLAANEHGDAWHRWAEDFSRDMRASLGAMFSHRVGSSKVVKAAPYSAEVITETNQPLADGNMISKKTSGKVYRDGEGRTRQETAGGKGHTVHISDPVAGKNLMLLPDSKKAIVTPRIGAFAFDSRDKRAMRFGASEIRIEDGKVFLDGKEVASGKLEIRAGNKDIRVENGRVTIDGKEVSEGLPKVVVRKIDASESGDGTRREEVRIQVLRSGDTTDVVIPMPPIPPEPPLPPHARPVPPLPGLPGASTLRFESTARLGKGTISALGSRDFEGVKAEGKSTVWVIPAGEIGNRNPIQVTSETWYSPELQVTVYARHNDPRQGESIYRLAAIKRGEPAPELFKAPEGYEIKGRAPREERR